MPTAEVVGRPDQPHARLKRPPLTSRRPGPSRQRAGPIGAKKAARGPTRETQGSLRSAAARRPTRGWFWWDSTRLLLPLADDPEYAGQLTGPARASPGPLMPAAAPHRPSP